MAVLDSKVNIEADLEIESITIHKLGPLGQLDDVECEVKLLPFGHSGRSAMSIRMAFSLSYKAAEALRQALHEEVGLTVEKLNHDRMRNR